MFKGSDKPGRKPESGLFTRKVERSLARTTTAVSAEQLRLSAHQRAATTGLFVDAEEDETASAASGSPELQILLQVLVPARIHPTWMLEQPGGHPPTPRDPG